MSLPLFITNPDPKIYLSDNYCVLDLEITNNDYGDARNSSNYIVCGASYFSSGRTLSIRSLDDLYRYYHRNWDDSCILVAQNAKFELKWLIRAGVDVSKLLIYDTMIGDYVRAGNRASREHPEFNNWRLNLNAIAKRYGVKAKSHYIHTLLSSGICPSEVPFNALQQYNRQDVRTTRDVFLKQREVLKKEGLLPVFFLRCLTTPVLADMEMNGMYLDKQLVNELSLELNKEYNGIIRELDSITGGINMASPPQVAEFIYKQLGFAIPTDYRGNLLVGTRSTDTFPAGQPKTDEDTIKLLKPKTKKQEKFLDLKKKESKLRKKITTYINLFEEACKKDCMLHGDFNQTITANHRLSSSHPNLQNIDRKLKKVVMARKPDWKIMSCDEVGVEFRTGGELSQDPQILDDIINKFDVHSYTASIIFEKEWKKAGSTKETEDGKWLRYDAKPFTFGPMYGKVKGTPSQVKYFDAFRKKYNVMTKVQHQWIDEVLDSPDDCLNTVTGLKLYFPGTKYTKSGYVINSTNIMNYPISMFATADISPTGVALWWHHMKAMDLQSFLIAEVHDSGVAEVHPDEVEVMEELADRCMTTEVIDFLEKVINYRIKYPLETEIDTCKHWDWIEEDK